MPITFKREISIGTLIQLVTLVISGIWFLSRVSLKQEQILLEQRNDRARWERVEKYLSSKDSHYWEIIRRFDDPATALRPSLQITP